jgi:soluble lytic murein transglycosylase
MRRLLLLCLLLAPPAAAQTPILLALRAQDWSLATTLADTEHDLLAHKLVTFIRLLTPDQASATELARFMADNPTWPDRPTLEHRYADALANEADANIAAPLCHQHPPQAAPALARCATAFALLGDAPAATQAARHAWTTGLTTPELESAFLARWPGLPTPADQVVRFDLLERTDTAAARRQIARLDSRLASLATARLAFRLEDPNAMATLEAVPAAQRDDPALLLAEARFLRRTHADEAALALWHTALPEAEAATPAAQRAPFWTERDALARRLLTQGDAAGAYRLADDSTLAPDQAMEADFLAGWIALEHLHDGPRALSHFQALASLSHAAITQARAFYWLARTTPDKQAAQAFYLRAGAWPFTYYGQLAARAAGVSEAALHQAIAAAQDPILPAAEQIAFARSEPARAATLLAAWDDKRRGADFLTLALQPPATLTTRTLVATLALRLDLPDVAVQAARLAGRDGAVLPRAGWPLPYTPPAAGVPSPLVLAVMRQESSFDPTVTSAAGAHGLMQLMQPTANQLSQTLHVAAAPLTDPDINMRLGEAYLANLLSRFAPCTPCAIAAYNAGPRRADEWITANGKPADSDTEAAIDWIEAIPFAETRNYVERVLENATIYAAKSQ